MKRLKGISSLFTALELSANAAGQSMGYYRRCEGIKLNKYAEKSKKKKRKSVEKSRRQNRRKK